MRHRLNKAGRTPSFPILDQDVNNVPPSKQTGNSRLGSAIFFFFFISDAQHFLQMAHVNTALQSKVGLIVCKLGTASHWMERLIIGTQGAKWKNKGNIPEGSHWTKQPCHSVKAWFGKHDDTGSCVTWKKVWPTSKTSTTWKNVTSTQHLCISRVNNKQTALAAVTSHQVKIVAQPNLKGIVRHFGKYAGLLSGGGLPE